MRVAKSGVARPVVVGKQVLPFGEKKIHVAVFI
jgi:hypothetical protein